MTRNNKIDVYIFGPIHIYGDDFLPVYKELSSVCDKRFKKVIGTYPDFWDTDEDPDEFYKRTIREITDVDVFVAEVTTPSHGVGMELQMAYNNDIPVIALAKSEEDISSMVVGNPAVVELVRYDDPEELYDTVPEKIISVIGSIGDE